MIFALSIFIATTPAFFNVPNPVISYKYSGTKLSVVEGEAISTKITSAEDLYVKATGVGTLYAGLDLETEISIDWAGAPQQFRPEFFTLHLLSTADEESSRVTRSVWKSSHDISRDPLRESAPSELLVKVPTNGARYSFKYRVSNTVDGVVKGPSPGSIYASIDLRLEPLPTTTSARSYGRRFASYLDTSLGRVVASKLPPDNKIVDEKRPKSYGKGYRLGADRVNEPSAPMITFDPKRNVEYDRLALETLGIVAFGKNWRFKKPEYLNASLQMDYQGKKFWFYPALALGDPRFSVSGIPDSSPIIKVGEQDPIWLKYGKPGETLPRVDAEFRGEHAMVKAFSGRKSRWIQWYGGQLLYHHYAVLNIRTRTGHLLEETPIVWREQLFTSPNVAPTYAQVRLGLDYDGGPLPFGN